MPWEYWIIVLSRGLLTSCTGCDQGSTDGRACSLVCLRSVCRSSVPHSTFHLMSISSRASVLDFEKTFPFRFIRQLSSLDLNCSLQPLKRTLNTFTLLQLKTYSHTSSNNISLFDSFHHNLLFPRCSTSRNFGSTWTTALACAASPCHAPRPQQASLPPHQLTTLSLLHHDAQLPMNSATWNLTVLTAQPLIELS